MSWRERASLRKQLGSNHISSVRVSCLPEKPSAKRLRSTNEQGRDGGGGLRPAVVPDAVTNCKEA